MRYIVLLQSLQERKITIKGQIKFSEDFRGIYLYISWYLPYDFLFTYK